MPEIAWVLIAVLVVAIVGGLAAVWQERRRPSSYSRGGDLARWAALSAEAQEVEDDLVLGFGARFPQAPGEAVDEAFLDLAQQARVDAEDDAGEAARFLADRVRDNSLYRP